MIDLQLAREAIRALLSALGENPDRDGLADTPRRVAAAYAEMLSGEDADVAAMLATQFDGGGYDEIVALRGVTFTSLCEHHLLPFSGTASLAYLPGDRVVGLSKLARLVEAHARRLQIQERMTSSIADDLEKHLAPRGTAVIVEAEHSCMACRGIRKAGARMVTSAMRGFFRNDQAARAEVMALLRARD